MPQMKALNAPSNPETFFMIQEPKETFSRKLFVGGLPLDITKDEIIAHFSKFGKVLVDWPLRSDTSFSICSTASQQRSMGFAFLIYDCEPSVHLLIKHCYIDNDKYYIFMSSATINDRPVEVRPWRLSDVDWLLDPNMEINPHFTVFVGGVPRPTKASEIAEAMTSLYGQVCYAGLDIDHELRYPKNYARVTFVSMHSFLAAVKNRYASFFSAGLNAAKKVEVKPYVMDSKKCDQCCGTKCEGKLASLYCGHLSCLQYFCRPCWDEFHYGPHASKLLATHKPLIRIQNHVQELSLRPHGFTPRR